MWEGRRAGVFRARRMELVCGQNPVAVAVEGLERRGGPCDLCGGELAVVIGVEGEQERRRSVVGWRRRVVARGGGSGGLSEQSGRRSKEQHRAGE